MGVPSPGACTSPGGVSPTAPPPRARAAYGARGSVAAAPAAAAASARSLARSLAVLSCAPPHRVGSGSRSTPAVPRRRDGSLALRGPAAPGEPPSRRPAGCAGERRAAGELARSRAGLGEPSPARRGVLGSPMTPDRGCFRPRRRRMLGPRTPRVRSQYRDGRPHAWRSKPGTPAGLGAVQVASLLT